MTDVIDEQTSGGTMPTLRVEHAADERSSGAAEIVPQLRTKLGLDSPDAPEPQPPLTADTTADLVIDL